MAQSDIKAGSAYVELLLKNSKFLSGLRKSGQMLYSFARGAAIAGSAIAAAGIAAAGVGLKQFVSLGGALDDMSKRIGVSAESLSELKYAAEQSGTSLGVVEKALKSMQANGIDPARFDELAASVAAIEDPTKRAQKAMEVWGKKTGPMLLPMLGDLQALKQEARDLGLVMGDEAASRAERLGDMFDKLWLTVKAGSMALGQAVAPFIEQALPVIQSFATQSLRAIQAASAYINANIGSITSYIVSAWQSTVDYVGPIIGSLVVVVSDGFNAIWQVAQAAWGGIQSLITAVWGNVTVNTGSVMQWLQDTIIGTFSVISFVFTNWQLLANTALTSAELALVRFGNQAMHVFGTVVPSYLTWLGENFFNIFRDMNNVVMTVSGNIWKNLKELWAAIIALFNGEDFDFKPTALLDGFESALTELPIIAERQMGPLEKSLQEELDGLAEDVLQSWDAHDKKFRERAGKFTPTNAGIEEMIAAGRITPADRGASDLGGFLPGKKDEVFGSFSAAALAAQGGGAGKDPVVDAIDRQDQKQAKRDDKLLRAIEAGVMT